MAQLVTVRDRWYAPPTLEWLLQWIIPEPNCGCWLWGGAINPGGYGTVILPVTRERMGAHRAAWLLSGREIPAGHDLDHRCRVRCCVNPDHLEPVTRGENLRRGIGPGLLNARRSAATHCPRGHPYSGDNLFIDKRGRRDCKECRRERTRQWRVNHA